MSRHETEQASLGRHPAEGQMPRFAHQEGKLLIAVGVSLLPFPLVVQFAGDLIEQFPWVRLGTQIALFLLFFGAVYFWGQHRSAAWRRSPWAQDFLWLLTVLVGVVPLAMMLVAVMGGPDASGESLGRVFLRMGGYWLPVVFVVALGGGGRSSCRGCGMGTTPSSGRWRCWPAHTWQCRSPGGISQRTPAAAL
jgi:hypothetical protein